MMLRLPTTVLAAVACIVSTGVSGCSGATDSGPPEVSIEQKLDSTDPAERMQALEEAEQKYGAAK